LNKVNFDAEMCKIIDKLDHRPRLLLHSCCGPCSTACLERLVPHFEVVLFFYNPNVMPFEEYQKRLASQRIVCEHFGVEFIEGGYDLEKYKQMVSGMESDPEGGARCLVCFYLRLKETAQTARKGGFEYFATTLTVSPHKNSQVINAVGYQVQDETEVKFLPSDFKKKSGFLRSTQLSDQLGLYRQSYCGCKL